MHNIKYKGEENLLPFEMHVSELVPYFILINVHGFIHALGIEVYLVSSQDPNI